MTTNKEDQKKGRPIVVVTGPDKRFRFGWWASELLLKRYGLSPRYITASSQDIPENIDGVLIGGGDDIEPHHYGIAGDGKGSYDRARDRMEMDVVKKAFESEVPVLGICRGAQLVNIALGGSLYPDIRSFRRHTPRRNSILPTKLAYISKEDVTRYLVSAAHAGGLNKTKATDFNGIVDSRHQLISIKINQLHHQAIDKLGAGLRVIAKDDDQIIQAVVGDDSDAGKSIVGVQWHPEYMPYSKIQRGIFKKFSEKVYSCNKRN